MISAGWRLLLLIVVPFIIVIYSWITLYNFLYIPWASNQALLIVSNNLVVIWIIFLVLWALVLLARHYRQKVMMESAQIKRDCAVDLILWISSSIYCYAVVVFTDWCQEVAGDCHLDNGTIETDIGRDGCQGTWHPFVISNGAIMSLLIFLLLQEESIRFLGSSVFHKFTFYTSNYNCISNCEVRSARILWYVFMAISQIASLFWLFAFVASITDNSIKDSSKIWATSLAIIYWIVAISVRAAS